ncbi:MAG: hypothetical protein SF052_12675 [Bacteroidia bacterium]|nr:hypothetical protein [Bacteroidia bacterium]
MDPRIKPILIILLTLVIGFAAGFISSGWIVKKRFENMRKIMDDQAHFENFFSQIAQADPEQMAKIRPILEKYHEEVRQSQRIFFTQMRERSDSLRLQLKPYLTEEQIEKVIQEMKFRGRKRNHRQPEGLRPPEGPPMPHP